MNEQDRYIQLTGWNEDRQMESLQRTYTAIYAEQMPTLVAWNLARLDCYDNPDPDDPTIGSCFLGSVFAIMPSGKYWVWWACSNVSRDEIARDYGYRKALDQEAESRNMWIENSEYDPCDLLICCHIE